MFPINFNFPFRKSNGELTTIGKMLENAGGGGSYTLPTASANVKGGVKIGDGLEMDGEVLNATGGTPYELPTASANVKGGVKIGSGLEMDGEVLNATGGGGSTLYEHNILIGSNESSNKQYNLSLKIINNTNTPYTITTLKEFLYNNGFTYSTGSYPASGGYNSSGTVCPVVGVYKSGSASGSLDIAYATNMDAMQSSSTDAKLYVDRVREI